MTDTRTHRSRVSIVVPVHDNGDDFRRCLEALLACNPPPHEIIVVDDGSPDDSAAFARGKGVQTLELERAHGPAFARNRGAEAATGDILLFVDADVVAPPDTVAKVTRFMSEQPAVAAVFGSYDDAPAAAGVLSRYRNLLHHWVHQRANEDASTFWAGCGAVRKSVFDACGGFAESYTRPSIEDVEFGLRLRAAGYRIRLCKTLLCRHLKRWTWHGTIRTDIFDRALPWSRLARRHGLPDDLNFRLGDRLSALFALLLAPLCAGAFFLPGLWFAVALCAGALIFLNREFYGFLLRKLRLGGLFCIPWHWLYLVYSSLVFAGVWLLPLTKNTPGKDE